MSSDASAVVRLDRMLDAGLLGDGVHQSLGSEDADLNVNVVHLDEGSRIAEHVNDEVDVLLIVVDGSGRLRVGGRDAELVPTTVAYLALGESRAISAGPSGLTYVTAHRARGQLRVR